MNEEEVPTILNIDPHNKPYFEDIKFPKKYDRKDEFIFAMAFGFIHNFQLPLKKKEFMTRQSYLKDRDEALMSALALKTTGNIEVLSNRKEIYKIAEEYANGGIRLLSEELSSKPGNFEKKVEKLLLDIYDKIQDDSYKTPEKIKTNYKKIDSYLEKGENERIEYKSSLRWDTKQNNVNKILEKVIAKSIAGFLNTDGGTLLIGVRDDGSIYGIEKDIETLNRRDLDGFQQSLIQLIQNFLGINFTKYVHINFEKKDEKTVCIINVEHSPKPVFLKYKSNQEFYIRAGNTTKPLNPKEMLEYTEMHWI